MLIASAARIELLAAPRARARLRCRGGLHQLIVELNTIFFAFGHDYLLADYATSEILFHVAIGHVAQQRCGWRNRWMVGLLFSLLIIVIVAAILYAIVQALPLAQPFKNIALILGLLIILVWVLSVVGIWGPGWRVHID